MPCWQDTEGPGRPVQAQELAAQLPGRARWLPPGLQMALYQPHLLSPRLLRQTWWDHGQCSPLVTFSPWAVQSTGHIFTLGVNQTSLRALVLLLSGRETLASHLTPLSLSFLICKAGIKVVPSSSGCCEKAW